MHKQSFLICVLSLFFSVSAFGQGSENIKFEDPNRDSSNAIVITGRIQISNTGFAPVPAFSFNSPIAVGFISLKKKRLSYDPDFALGLNGKPWMMNNWFRIQVFERKRVTLKASLNPSLFFKNEKMDSGENIIHAQRNLAFEFSSEYKFSKKWSINLSYARNTACDVGALSGNFFDISVAFSSLHFSKNIFLSVKEQLFYFDFGNFDGLFTSTHVRLSDHRIPLALSFQGVAPLWSGFQGNHFKWNAGIAFFF